MIVDAFDPKKSFDGTLGGALLTLSLGVLSKHELFMTAKLE